MNTKLYTIGHSTHSTEHFIRLLEQNGVTAVCDVRSTPYSRTNPQFNRETIKNDLNKCDIAYVFLGKELGARSDNPEVYLNDKVQFGALANDRSFKEGLDRLRQGMQGYVVALMCAEKDPISCHRTILICPALKNDSLSIFHIDATGEPESHESVEKRLMQTLGIEPDMFLDERECIEQAYDQQSKKIAYVRRPHSHAAASR